MAEKKYNNTGVLKKVKDYRGEPQMYNVIIHNDDFTPQEFVVELLQKYFYHPHPRARSIMLAVHTMGKSTAGMYTKEVAETKARNSVLAAQASGFPLMLTYEPLK